MRVARSTGLYRGMKPYYAAALFSAGRTRWWIDGRTGEQVPGSLQLKEPGQVHHDRARFAPGAFQSISFDDDIVHASRDAFGIPTSARLATVQIAPRDPRASALRRLHRLAAEPTDSFALESAIAEAVAEIVSHLETSTARTRGDGRLRVHVRRAREFLLTHLAESITLDDLADHARTDKFHLSRAFTAEIGLPPHAFLTNARIARARVLLARGVRPSDVAPELGFCDQSQMHRHFVRIVGVTPGEYARARGRVRRSPRRAAGEPVASSSC